jgi:hypothetical protein
MHWRWWENQLHSTHITPSPRMHSSAPRKTPSAYDFSHDDGSTVNDLQAPQAMWDKFCLFLLCLENLDNQIRKRKRCLDSTNYSMGLIEKFTHGSLGCTICVLLQCPQAPQILYILHPSFYRPLTQMYTSTHW